MIDLEQLESIYSALKGSAKDFVEGDDHWQDHCDEFLSGVNGIDLGKFCIKIVEQHPEMMNYKGMMILMFVMFAMGLEAGRREKFMEEFSASLID